MSVDYRARLRRVYAAIHDDPAGEHSLDAMADLAALSRFHFHRVFAAMTGETLAEAVRRVRLHRAAEALVRGEAPLADLAGTHGYADAAGFSRAFRAAYGMSPGAFRRQGKALPATLRRITPEGESMYPVTLETTPPQRLIGLPFTGPYLKIGSAFDRLSAEIGALGLWPRTRGMVGVYLDDPGSVPAEALRSFAGVLVAEDLPLPEGLQEYRLAGGRHARMAFRGPYSGMGMAYDWLYGSWLAASGEAPRGAPCWELYLNTPLSAAPEDLRTDIFLPLEETND
ncbi:AraC family transcriptional regulator [Pararhodobacter sp.]|uniref:AraC family transcriptional regulator n=1 Tax=Pararhodobacter sp. TaxID=2127056 RepID=UPI002FE0174A